jgi:hypothetical protein
MTTNISDLPGGNSNQPNIQLHTKDLSPPTHMNQTNNPGKPGQPDKVSLNSINEMVSGLQKAAQNNMTRLPNRDVPFDPERITRDPNIQPNYIPPPTQDGYIEDEMDYEYMMQRNQNEKFQRNNMDNLYDEIQSPVMVGILFFLFQLPFVNKLLLKIVPSLFKDDGHPLFSGYLLKALLFGICVFIMNKGFDMLIQF